MGKYKKLPVFLKHKRKEVNITQRECALKAGIGLRFVREIEQGKQTLNIGKVNQVLALFGYSLQPKRINEIED